MPQPPGRLEPDESQAVALALAHLTGPSVYALTAAADLEPVDPDAPHARRVVQPVMSRHAACVCPLLGSQLQHRGQEVRDALCFLFLKVVLFPQHVGEGPMPEPVDVSQISFPGEDLLRPLA